ncbi:phosphotransferase family protein [Streptosporangium sp. DT93]|uniref:phosphotransferase family protein n=1 Tax=Streptosporangium sp. DT93 TaxID=3393428 RepID=UPI003CF882EF
MENRIGDEDHDRSARARETGARPPQTSGARVPGAEGTPVPEAGEARVREAVAARLPGYRAGTVTPLGEGEDNTAYEVDGELIVRFAKEPDPTRRAALVEREARLLGVVAAVSPLPVPEPRFTDPERGCLAYPTLAGVPLLALPGPQRAVYARSVGTVLGGLLRALHAVPAARVDGLVEADGTAPAEWLDEAAEIYPAIAGELPASCHEAVRAFLDAPPPEGGDRPVLSHNDLGIEHVLVDPGTGAVTGIIDWSDAALVDPAHDFGLLYRDLGPDALEAALLAYGPSGVSLHERAVFHGRCRVFEDLAYGIETGREVYVGKCLVAMEWLFPG